VGFVVYWMDKKTEKEVKLILPEIELERE